MNQRQRDVVVIKAWESEHGRAYDSKSVWDFAMKMEENIPLVSYGNYEITRPPWLDDQDIKDLKKLIKESDPPTDAFIYSWVKEFARRAGYNINLSEAEDITMKFFRDDS